MKAAYINPFINAVSHLFKTMLTLSVKIGQPALNKDAQPQYDVCGVIDVSGEVSGRVVVSMSEPVATSLASELLGDTIDKLDEGLLDIDVALKAR